ncbi:vomeronasal type-2 receptor 26-like [Ranitomeya imitator]|uniref:vomeronasal type-2 receptor 26-like n=1 Tax=Ranitomeya imitator TaxID=111125 RepID=UPI0037E74CFB
MIDVLQDTEKLLLNNIMFAAMSVYNVLRRINFESNFMNFVDFLKLIDLNREDLAKIGLCCNSALVKDKENGSGDSEICHRCPDDKWPDEKKVKCVPKTYEFLSYEKDEIVIIFIFTSILLSVVTIFILGIFIHYWETPIVKANNRIVSFILLVSTFLSFMSIFLFLGPPDDVTCMLRQIIFGISLSISLSSILSKTITVCIAFKATKPNSVWRRWIGLKTSKYVVVTCSSVQVLICVFWISLRPPYREYDKTLYTDRIIIQCNEGSDIWFYSMLGYLGLLAALSFVLAFMVRTLPDNFNEAKYITFSMLVFCSVWISMIPAYLSSKGKIRSVDVMIDVHQEPGKLLMEDSTSAAMTVSPVQREKCLIFGYVSTGRIGSV